VANKSIAECHLVDRACFCIELTRYLKRTFFNQYSRKYIKIIHLLVGHAYSLVPLAMADHSQASTADAASYCNMFSQCFFKVLKRVSWWSFSVLTPFSLLSFILLTDFRKNASFRPYMLNKLSTTFIFGKQTKNNFNSERFNAGLFIHSFLCLFFL